MAITTNIIKAARMAQEFPQALADKVVSAAEAAAQLTYEVPTDRFTPQALEEGTQKLQRLQNFAQQHRSSREASIRAEYMYKFLNLMEFPNESHQKELRVGILGDEKMRESFQQNHEGKSVRGMPVKLVSIREQDDLEGLNMIFVGKGEKNKNLWLQSAKDRNVFTVESGLRETPPKAAAKFFNAGDRVRFQFDVSDIRDAGVKISPRLVKVAAGLFR